MEDARVMTLDYGGTLCSAPGTTGADLLDDELAPSPDDNNAQDWDFTDGPIDYHIYVRSRLRREFDAFGDWCRSANAIVLQNANRVFSFALKNLHSEVKHYSIIAVKSEALKLVVVVENTAAASLAC